MITSKRTVEKKIKLISGLQDLQSSQAVQRALENAARYNKLHKYSHGAQCRHDQGIMKRKLH